MTSNIIKVSGQSGVPICFSKRSVRKTKRTEQNSEAETVGLESFQFILIQLILKKKAFIVISTNVL